MVKKYLSVLGGILMNLVTRMQCAGALNAWGTLSLYVVSYYHLTDSSASLGVFLVVFPVWCFFDGPGICRSYADLADLLFRRFGIRFTTAIAGAVYCSGFFVASYLNNAAAFLIVFGVVTGVGEGLSIMTPVWNCWRYFPQRKGRASGAVLFGYGCGAPVFGVVFTFLVNPYNRPATVHISDGQASYYLFSSDVADRVPAAMREMALIFLCLYAIAALLQTDAAVDEVPTPRTRVALSGALLSREFWRLLFALALSRCFGLYLLNVFKALGQQFYSDDHFLSLLGSIVTASEAVGRILLPSIADFYSFRTTMCLSLAVQVGIAATLWFVTEWQWMYALWLCLCMLASGGCLSVFALETAQIFGTVCGLGRAGHKVFSFVTQGITVSAVLALLVVNCVSPVRFRQSYGYEVSFWVFCALILAAIALVVVPANKIADDKLLESSA